MVNMLVILSLLLSFIGDRADEYASKEPPGYPEPEISTEMDPEVAAVILKHAAALATRDEALLLSTIHPKADRTSRAYMLWDDYLPGAIRIKKVERQRRVQDRYEVVDVYFYNGERLKHGGLLSFALENVRGSWRIYDID